MYNTYGDNMNQYVLKEEGKENVDFKNKRIIYKNKSYTIDEWLSEVCCFYKRENNVFYVKTMFKGLPRTYVLTIFRKNIKKYSVLGLILPCALFLSLFLVSVAILLLEKQRGNFGVAESVNSLIFLSFLSLLFIILGIVLLYRIILKKERCYLSKKSGRYRYTYIKKKEYCDICNYLVGGE